MAEDRWNEIVQAAKELFLEKEYEKTTLQDVMNKVGIAKGTVYHYFVSKLSLLDAVVEHMVDETVTKLKSQFIETKGTALERMQTFITLINRTEEEGILIENLHRPGNIGLHTKLLASLVSKLAPFFAELIEQGCKEGVFHTEHPLESAEIIFAGIQLVTDVGFYPWKKEDLHRRMKAIPAMTETLLGAPKGSFAFLAVEES